MPQPSQQLNTAEDIERQFYEALNRGDLERLMDCWTQDEDPVCIPPGGDLITGATDIRRLFEALFANAKVSMKVTQTHRIEHDAHVIQTVLEAVDVATDDGPAIAEVIAVNVYAITSRGWRLQLHHASPGVMKPKMPSPQLSPSATIH